MVGNDEVLAAGLARGMSRVAAARDAGMSEVTAKRRMQDPGFVVKVQRLREAEAVDFATSVRSARDKAWTRIVEMLDDKNRSRRLQAIKIVMSVSTSVELAGDLGVRVSSLEAAAAVARRTRENPLPIDDPNFAEMLTMMQELDAAARADAATPEIDRGSQA